MGGRDLTPFDAIPERMVSSVWVAPPHRWRAETTIEGGAETGILVLDGSRSGFAVASRDPQGAERFEPNKESPLSLHGIVLGMIDGDETLDLLDLESVGMALHGGRECFQLVGSLRDSDNFPVWPADSYEVLVDRHRGILVSFTARLGTTPFASAAFSTVAFDVELPDDTFAVSESPDGRRWPTRSSISMV